MILIDSVWCGFISIDQCWLMLWLILIDAIDSEWFWMIQFDADSYQSIDAGWYCDWFWLMLLILGGSEWFWLILFDADSYQSIDAGWCCDWFWLTLLILSDSELFWLILFDADWWWWLVVTLLVISQSGYLDIQISWGGTCRDLRPELHTSECPLDSNFSVQM